MLGFPDISVLIRKRKNVVVDYQNRPTDCMTVSQYNFVRIKLKGQTNG